MSDEINLHETMDAAVWASEFCKRWPSALCQIPGKEGVDDGDEFMSTMVGWFANAIMTGYDTANTRSDLCLTTEQAATLCDRLAVVEAERDAAVKAARLAHDALWELNPANYNHDEVCKANDGAIEAILTLAPIIGETHGKPPEWWTARAALQSTPAKEQADE